MEGFTVSEIVQKTGLNPKTIHSRLRILGIKPLTKEALYAPSVLKAIEEMRPVGRPKKSKPSSDTEPVAPSKKA